MMENDGFDAKRDMVKQLLAMLKSSAAAEVSNGMATHEKAEPMPEPHEIGQKIGEMRGDHIPEHSVEKMSDGGMPADTDEPEEFHLADAMARMKGVDGSSDEEAVKNLPGPIEDEEKERDEAQDVHNYNMMDEDEDSNQSAFQAFLPRKKNKK